VEVERLISLPAGRQVNKEEKSVKKVRSKCGTNFIHRVFTK
jgi:hypothetical protein